MGFRVAQALGPKTIRFFLTRHGESDANRQPETRFHTCEPQISLTTKGWQQALADGAFLKNFCVKSPPLGDIALLHGSLDRQRQSAQGVYKGYAGRIRICREYDELNEMNFGLAGPLPRNQWQGNYPDYASLQQMLCKGDADYFFGFPGGESRAGVQFRGRVGLMSDIRAMIDRGITDFIIETSSVNVRMLAKMLNGIPYEDLAYERAPGNGDIRLIETDEWLENPVDKGYIFRNGLEQEPAVIPHKSDTRHFEDGDYFPAFARGAMKLDAPLTANVLQ